MFSSSLPLLEMNDNFYLFRIHVPPAPFLAYSQKFNKTMKQTEHFHFTPRGFLSQENGFNSY